MREIKLDRAKLGLASNNGNDDGLREKIKTARLSPNEEIQEVPILLVDDIPAFTAGNFSCITGPAKSRKTFLVTALELAYLTGSNLDGKLARGDSSKLKVLHFDTEQSRSKSVEQLRSKLNAYPEIQDDYSAFNLRPYGYNQRLEIIRQVLESTPNLGLVVIDGIRDLLADINSIEESCLLVEKLMKWSQDIHIICVLHQNKGDGNVRGHLGSEIVNKAETTIQVEKDAHDKFVSVVKAKFCRDSDFPDFAFGVNDIGLPVLAEGFGKTEAIRPDNIPLETHKQIVTSIFLNHRDLSTNKLASCLQAAYGENGLQIGIVKAKRDFINYLILKKLIANTNEQARNGSSHKYNKI